MLIYKIKILLPDLLTFTHTKKYSKHYLEPTLVVICIYVGLCNKRSCLAPIKLDILLSSPY